MELTAEQLAAEKQAAETKASELKASELKASELKAAETKAAEIKKQTKAEALRDLSKELGINAFEPEELKKKFNEFTTWQTDQKSEQEKLQEQSDSYKTKVTELETEIKDYKGKLKASELGIHADYLEDALKIAGGDAEKLVDVIKKYPNFKTKEGIKIGVQDPNNQKTPTNNTEVEKYMADNKRIYGRK